MDLTSPIYVTTYATTYVPFSKWQKSEHLLAITRDELDRERSAVHRVCADHSLARTREKKRYEEAARAIEAARADEKKRYVEALARAEAEIASLRDEVYRLKKPWWPWGRRPPPYTAPAEK
jgi:hypothetical protein